MGRRANGEIPCEPSRFMSSETTKPADDERPWERPEQVRRDAEVGRGHLLAWLATKTLWCAMGTFCLPFLAAIALPLGLCVYFAAHGDLKRSLAGQIDIAEEDLTAQASETAVRALFVCALALLVWLLIAMVTF